MEEKLDHEDVEQEDAIMIEYLPSKCKQCGGEGRVKQSNRYIQTSEGVREQDEECPLCSGTGWI